MFAASRSLDVAPMIPSPAFAHLWPSSRLSGRRLMAAILMLVIPVAGNAAAPPPVALTPQQSAELQRVAGYLNAIRTMTARFQQTAANGGGSRGRLWGSRAGGMRLGYEHPATPPLFAEARLVYHMGKEVEETA